MRYAPISSRLFIENRRRLAERLEPKSIAIINNNDILPTNADGALVLQPSSDLFYLTGVEQEESVLLLFPDAHDPRQREILFLRELTPLVQTWEGAKLSQKEARQRTGIERVEWLSSLPGILHAALCEADHVYLNANEHPRAVVEVETREARFVREIVQRYPLHSFRRLARLLHQLRLIKSAPELELLRKACALTRAGFERVARFVEPGVREMEVEAEFAHEFIRHGGKFAYTPIIASGENANALHYIQNDGVCRKGDLLLLDVAASYANYNADLTRTIPVSGHFTKRQRRVYDAVLRVFRASAALLRPGLLPKEWREESEELITRELLDLGLLKKSEVRKQGPEKKALKKYFMHGIGHPIGLDVHDVGNMTEPMKAGWVLTCEPAIYLHEEGFGIRLENMLLVTEKGAVDLFCDVPIEAEAIEDLMRRR